MKGREAELAGRYFFSLPRLVAWLRGESATRSEQNAAEAFFVGSAIHGIAYLWFARLFLAQLTPWKQLALALPLTFVVWICWLLFVYLAALGTRLVRWLGAWRRMPDARAQGVIICSATTLCALDLADDILWISAIGIAWIAAVLLNLAASAVLAFTHATTR